MKLIHFSRATILAIVVISGREVSQAQQQVQKSSPAELVDALHTAFGNNHSRAVHAKGIILEGTFTPDKEAAKLTKAPHLQKKSSKVVVRFSNFTGIPTIPDNIGAANPRGLAVKFLMDDGTSSDIVSHSFNGFPTSDTDQFRELLLAIGASSKETVHPNTLEKFLDTHPIAKTFLTTQKTPASYGAINYFGVNSFKFTNKHNESHFIRYQFIADGGEEILTEAQVAKMSSDYLIDEIPNRISKHPIKFRLYAEIAENGDAIENPSLAWPLSRKKMLLGVLELTKMASNTTEEDKETKFSPNNIPDGIATADPMLNFRSKAYPISVKERQ